jgi:hypothetical protein
MIPSRRKHNRCGGSYARILSKLGRTLHGVHAFSGVRESLRGSDGALHLIVMNELCRPHVVPPCGDNKFRGILIISINPTAGVELGECYIDLI